MKKLKRLYKVGDLVEDELFGTCRVVAVTVKESQYAVKDVMGDVWSMRRESHLKPVSATTDREELIKRLARVGKSRTAMNMN